MLLRGGGLAGTTCAIRAVRPHSGRHRRPIELLGRLPGLSGRTWQSRPLDGGLTNRNFHVRTDSGEQYVARLSNHKSALLGIDRAAEFHNTSTAAAAGVGARRRGVRS